MNRSARVGAILALLCVLGTTSGANVPAQMTDGDQRSSLDERTDDRARIERLAELAEVWGAAKYFHPRLAYPTIDWDQAVIQSMPDVEAAATPTALARAMNDMLGRLGDVDTRVEPTGKRPSLDNDENLSKGSETPLRQEDGVLWMDVRAIEHAIAADESMTRRLVGRFRDMTAGNRIVVLDLRSDRQDQMGEGVFANAFLRAALPIILDRPVTLGTQRFRLHSGFPTEAGNSSGGYYSALTTVTPEVIPGNSKRPSPRMVVLVNAYSPLLDIASGLQASGLAYAIQAGGAPTGRTTSLLAVSQELQLRMTTSELVTPEGVTGFMADMRVADDETLATVRRLASAKSWPSHRPAAAAPVPTLVALPDAAYADMTYPDRRYRLLALFRYWNIINYFYPDKTAIGQDWNAVLRRYVPRFEADRSPVDYQTTVLQLATETHDSHSFVTHTPALDARRGMYVPQVFLAYAQQQMVVSKVVDRSLPVKIGDVLLSVDGTPVNAAMAALAPITPASTPQSFIAQARSNLLRGDKDSLAHLRVRGHDGTIRDVDLRRDRIRYDAELYAASKRSGPVTTVLPSGVGYVDLDRLQRGDIESAMATIRDTPATIFDMRGYPQGTFWLLAPRLSDKPAPVAAVFSRPLIEAPNLSRFDQAWPDYSISQRIGPTTGTSYRGKVVVLINEDAISQAEHTCLFFEAAADVTFIGTPTAGADGDITTLVLPGDIHVNFGGHAVRHGDGRPLQGVGIQPTLRVEPTLAGIAGGRDEILEAAVAYLRQHADPPRRHH